VIETVREAYNRAKSILKDNMFKLNQIARVLIDRETMSGEEFMSILNEKPMLPAASAE
jgi:cell division protease FtsH